MEAPLFLLNGSQSAVHRNPASRIKEYLLIILNSDSLIF